MFGFQSIAHAFATIAQDVVKVAKKVGPVAAKAAIELQKVQGSEQTVEAITALVDPRAVVIERAAYQSLGHLVAACNATASAAGGGAVTVSLDAEAIAEYKALGESLKAELASAGVKI